MVGQPGTEQTRAICVRLSPIFALAIGAAGAEGPHGFAYACDLEPYECHLLETVEVTLGAFGGICTLHGHVERE
jgi:hypothetical protein